jgi:hypothetical protein
MQSGGWGLIRRFFYARQGAGQAFFYETLYSKIISFPFCTDANQSTHELNPIPYCRFALHTGGGEVNRLSGASQPHVGLRNLRDFRSGPEA